MSSDNSKPPKELWEEVKATFEKIEKQMKSFIQDGVKLTNNALASIEQSTEKMQPVVNVFKTAGTEGKHFAQEVGRIYSVRHEYAPYIVGGAAVLGGLANLRRGRIPALATGSVMGFLAYLGVYEVDVTKLPDRVFGKK